MSNPTVPPSPKLRRSLVGPVRYWCVLALIITLIVIELVMIIGHDPTAPRGGWFWPITAAAAAVCWSIRRTRPFAAVLLIIQVIALWSGVLFPQSPAEEKDGRILHLDQALLAVGAADLSRCLVAGTALLAAVLLFGHTTSEQPVSRPTRWLGFGIGVIVAALVVAAAVPGAYGLRTISRARVISGAEESVVHDRPDTTGSSEVTVGSRTGWSRTKIIAAQPAGDRVIAIEAVSTDPDRLGWHAIVGLRADDGAELWRYRVKGTAKQDAVDEAVIDRTTRMIMVRYTDALIGIDFDGRVRYRKPLAESTDPTESPTLAGDALDHSGPALQLGGVAVFGGDHGGAPSGFATGYSVATGEPQWQFTADRSSCEFAAAAGPGDRSYLLTAGKGCPAELIAYDGATMAFRAALKAPKTYVDAYASDVSQIGFADVPPSIAVAGADRVVTSPMWRSGPLPGNKYPMQQVTQIFTSTGELAGTLPADIAPYGTTRLLPTPLTTGPTSDLGAVVPDASDDPHERWLTLSPSLQTTDSTKINTGVGYQRTGPFLITWPYGGKGSDNIVTLTEVGPELGQGEQLAPTSLDRCGQQITAISADDTQLIIRCGRRIYAAKI